MANATKKRLPGRPRKPAAEKNDQFSIRLTPPVKVMLEMMARDRNLSLSQAVQHLITDVAGKYKIDGETLGDTLQSMVFHAISAIDEIEERFRLNVPEAEPIAKQTALFNSRYVAIFLMPERLLEAGELALARAVFAARRLPPDSELELLIADSKTMITFGTSVDEVTSYLVGRLTSDA